MFDSHKILFSDKTELIIKLNEDKKTIDLFINNATINIIPITHNHIKIVKTNINGPDIKK